MLRVGLTGGLGSGKSTVAGMFADLGAHVISADELGRELMEPGTAVFAAIVDRFGADVMDDHGRLDRGALARMAFSEGRVEELNAIVHPATIARQGELAEAIFAENENENAVVVAESALIFETQFGDGWRGRFDKLVLVAASEETKVRRFVTRSGGGDGEALAAEARRRLARMIPDEVKARECDFLIRNEGTLGELRAKVEKVWAEFVT